jgi:VIT1/CCC1 family predicted Fe2+/Mn2+ transporter
MPNANPHIPSDVAAHVVEARQRARSILGGEAHLGGVDDFTQAIFRVRDGVMLAWLLWMVLNSFSLGPNLAPLLTTALIGLVIFYGAAAAIATRSQLEYYDAELQRERNEVKHDFEHERQEVRELYAAKGFEPPLLDAVVDTICADEDRLLKVMLEEELGLPLARTAHPLVVGLWTAAAVAVGAAGICLAVWLASDESSKWWITLAGVALLAALAMLATRGQRPVMPVLASWLILAAAAGGVAHFIAGMFSSAA